MKFFNNPSNRKPDMKLTKTQRGAYRRGENGVHVWIKDFDRLDEAREFALLGGSCEIV